jgi:hypothetical protein
MYIKVAENSLTSWVTISCQTNHQGLGPKASSAPFKSPLVVFITVLISTYFLGENECSYFLKSCNKPFVQYSDEGVAYSKSVDWLPISLSHWLPVLFIKPGE